MKNSLVLALAAAAALVTARPVAAQLLINGAGATFPAPIYQRWFDDFTKVDPSVRINYQAIGSGAGLKQILSETVDFGASDDPVKDSDLASAPRELLQIPTVAGAIVLCYNLSGNPALKLDGPTIAGIYLGKITKWNDPAIAAQNPGVSLPGDDILVVYRTDGSGTTANFTRYLCEISPEWKSSVGTGKSVRWPTGLGGKGNQGVAGQIKQSPGAIGYVELAYAKQNEMPYADVKNAAGNYITPSIDSVKAAFSSARVDDKFRFSMINGSGAQAYPIASSTWLLLYAQQKDPAKGKALVEFLKWAYTTGEKSAPELDYAPLPEELVQRALGVVNQIKY
ncbi:MAG TPA: phosphate ABC transporter substrate-binding protein PstS [Opitutaceae bacterium]|jgi:phosphate transport system substrate-binding protein|nr:phosphate ABC transporter substrate-binding protein PstS [Opitutaceae bacterium]